MASVRVIPVGLLTSYLRELIEGDELLGDVWVEGEVTNFFAARSGHVYFTLRGDDGQLKCALFRPYASRQRTLPANGDQVTAHGRVGFFERDGAIQLYADVVEPAGVGLAALQVEQLRQRLAAEGLFDEARKRPLPPAPRVIGVVTSPDGAVWHDIQQVIGRRYPMAELLLAPCPVQGERAAAGIVGALGALQLDGRADVVIVARGGGSAEDLASFNDEAVVRAVFACRVPVVSGVGHETDWTLIDEVADLRAPTPSAAAELCVPSVVDLRDRLSELDDRLRLRIVEALSEERGHLGQARHRLLRVEAARPVAPRQAALRLVVRDGSRGARERLRRARAGLDRQQELLRALDPAAVLGRGYAVLADAGSGSVVTRAAAASPGQRLRADLADGALIARIEALAPGPDASSNGVERQRVRPA